MTHSIPKSDVQIPHADFQHHVENHVKELDAWAKQMAAVKAWQQHLLDFHNQNHRDPTPSELEVLRMQVPETHSYPPPTAHPHVVASIRIDSLNNGNDVKFVPDYVIFDDSPPPPPPEQVLQEKKSNLMLKLSHAEMMAMSALLPQSGKARLLQIQYDDLVGAQSLTAEQSAFVEDHRTKLAKLDALRRRAAQISSDIEDLTLDNIDGWQMGPLT